MLTSGNVSDEPIAYEDDDASRGSPQIADLFLLHDRPIETRTDDSVVRVAAGRPLVLRRSRGYVPDGAPLPRGLRRHLLACGAELKNTFARREGRSAPGSAITWATWRTARRSSSFERGSITSAPVRGRARGRGARPSPRVPVDQARARARGRRLSACSTITRTWPPASPSTARRGPAIGAIFDGAGYGSDGTVWGGELLVGGLGGFERVGSLLPVRMPGGDAAVREPWRMACAWLAAALAATRRAARRCAGGGAGRLAPGGGARAHAAWPRR